MNTKQEIEMDIAEAAVERVGDKIQKKINQAGERLEEFSTTARQQMQNTWEDTAERVRDNPMAALGIAVAAGAAVGVLLTVWAKRD